MRCPFCGSDTVGGSCPNCGRDLQVLEGIRSTRDWAHVDGTIDANKTDGEVHSLGLFVPEGRSGRFMKSLTVLTVVACAVLVVAIAAILLLGLTVVSVAGSGPEVVVICVLLVLPVLAGLSAVYVLWKHRDDWSEQRRNATDAHL